MKTVLFLLGLSPFILAQEYQKGKIDMHGGKFDNYNSIGGYKDGGFRKNSRNFSRLFDKNDSKKNQKKNTSNKKD